MTVRILIDEAAQLVPESKTLDELCDRLNMVEQLVRDQELHESSYVKLVLSIPRAYQHSVVPTSSIQRASGAGMRRVFLSTSTVCGCEVSEGNHDPLHQSIAVHRAL